jgi:hypothetical protein
MFVLDARNQAVITPLDFTHPKVQGCQPLIFPEILKVVLKATEVFLQFHYRTEGHHFQKY